MNNICLTGLAQSGKNTFATAILEHMLGMNEYALAEPIKEVLCALFGWDDKHKDGSLKEVELLYVITPDSLDKAGEVYVKYGIDKFEQFHDCWEKLIPLFGIEFNKSSSIYNCTISPRKAFQLFGTEWGRTVCPTIWLQLAPKNNTIITDVRFVNEAEYFKNLGAKVIRVERPGVKKVASHISEAGIPDSLVDIVVMNNSTKLDLESTAKYMVEAGFPNGVYTHKVIND